MAASVQEFATAHYEFASPGLLAQTPAFLDDTPPGYDPVWPVLYTHLQSRLNYMRSWRYTWWSYWSQLARLILPYRYHWVITPNSMNRGNPVNDAIINSTGTLAMQVCASGMLTGLMSPSRPWFRLAPRLSSQTLDATASAWLDDAAERILSVLAGSNFYEEGAQLYKDLATFGTSPMIIYEDREKIIRCYVPCAGEYMLAVGARLSVDTLYREYTYTVQQIVGWFGLENCPQQVRTQWEQGGASLDFEYVIAHAIEPNFALADRGKAGGQVSPVPGGFTYREVYWLRDVECEAPLSLRGFNEIPFFALRWSKTSNDPYGRGPGMDAYGDIAQLQHEEVRKGEYIDKFVRPPMVGDARLQNQPSSIRSGDITWVNGADGKQMFYPAFEVDPQGFGPLSQDIEKVENRINRCFFVDTFLMISQMEGVQPRNELELAMRQGEKIMQLGPVIESAENGLSIAIQRVIRIMQRRGLFAPMPDSLKGVPLKIDYVSIMKQAQRAAETTAMASTVKFAGELTEASQAAGMPAPIRTLDLDGMVRRYADIVGSPAKLIRSQQQVEQADQQKAKQAAAQQALEATLPAVQAAQGLSKIPIAEGQSALGAILGTGAPPAAPAGQGAP